MNTNFEPEPLEQLESGVKTDLLPRMPRILVAEDDHEMRRLLVWNLNKAGFDVVECSDGWELLDHLGNPVLSGGAEDFDLIVSDIRMPGVTGLEVLEGIHETAWFVPMILITAFGSDQVHEQAEQFGAAAIFDKPFEVDDLIQRIREVLVLDSDAGHNWLPRPIPPEETDYVPIDVIFDRMDPSDSIRQKVVESTQRLDHLQDRILYARAVLVGPGNNSSGRYHIQIMVTLSDKVFVVRSNLESIRSEAELRAAVPKAFDVTLGKIQKHLSRHLN